MKVNTEALTPWLGAILSKFISGLFHGTVVSGVVVSGGKVAADATGIPAQNPHLELWALIVGTAIGAVTSGIKDVAFFVNANPMPNIFAPPVIAPAIAPVAEPSISSAPVLGASNSNP